MPGKETKLQTSEKATCAVESVEIEIIESVSHKSTAALNLLYDQYTRDPDGTLLVDGFFKTGLPNRALPRDVHRLIAAYYGNVDSKGILLRHIQRRLDKVRYAREARIQTWKENTRKCCARLVVLIGLGCFIGKDIAMLAVNGVENCSFLNDGQTKVNEFGDNRTLSQLMNWIPFVHLLSILSLTCGAICCCCVGEDDRQNGVKAFMMIIVCPIISFVLSVLCCSLWSEADEFGVNSSACYGVLVAWPLCDVCALASGCLSCFVFWH